MGKRSSVYSELKESIISKKTGEKNGNKKMFEKLLR